MLSKPVPLALAMLVAAAFAAPQALAQAAAPAAPKQASAKPAGTLQKITLTTGIKDGKMVFLDAKGQANPTLKAKVGDTIEITISSGEGAQHDIVFPELNVHSAHFDKSTGPAKLRFKVTRAGTFEYYCTISGHRQVGMEGKFEVTGGSGAAPVVAAAPRAAAPRHAIDYAETTPIQGALPAVSVSMDPNAVPAPIGKRPAQTVKYRVETVELVGKLDDNTSFTYWTFGRKVPGPMLRVKAGDTVEFTLANSKDSKMIHSIDFHATTGPGGGAAFLQVPPGVEKTISFKALNPGLYVYHCATPSVPEHISAGMYGMILVEPEGGLPKVDREFYVMQGDIYTKHKTGTKGHQPFDYEKLMAELPDYFVFNGAVGALTKEHKMEVKVGETVRIYFGVGGPNKISSFHVIGEIFDRVYTEASTSAPRENVQTTTVPPGGAAIVEMKVEYPGHYVLVDHALSRVGKGAAGVLQVVGPKDAGVYRDHGDGAVDGPMAH
ncbi:MAG TPA: copper-containing nitrite reductase [Burkholderiales bacterium]|nr:copper-containing nitrite reductase [Burkholderiales bacterium]